MPFSAANKTSSPAIPALSQPEVAGGISAGAATTVAETSAPSAVQATRLVREIRAIADRISTIDRNTVEVRFDFSESDRLSVRVEYRDGTVHTTFRTDSAALRDAISTEWQAQAVASEPRSYQVAEPVFSSNSGSTSSDLSQSGQGSGHSRSFEQQSSPSFSGQVRSGRSSSSASAGGASVPASTVRPETSLHLHTFA